MNSLVDFDATFSCHGLENPIDATNDAVSYTTHKAIDGGGSWSLAFKTDEDGYFEKVIQRFVRDDDWVYLSLFDDKAQSRMIGLVDQVTQQETVIQDGPNRGAVVRNYTVSGSDWSKAMRKGQVRLGSILSTGTTRKTSGVSKTVNPFTPWPAGGTQTEPSPTFTTATGRALRWVLFMGTGTVDAVPTLDPQDQFRDTIVAAWASIGATPSKAHFIIPQAGGVYELCPSGDLKKNVTETTGIPALDSEAVVVAVVGAGMGTSYTPSDQQAESIGELCRWLSTVGCDTGRSGAWDSNYRWLPAGAVAPKYGLIGVNEVFGAGFGATNPWDVNVWPVIEAAVRPTIEVEDRVDLVDIPGIISETKYWEVLQSVVSNAFDGKGQAHVTFRRLLTKLLPGLYTEPGGKDLLSRLSWRYFGRPSVTGMPWRLGQAFPQQYAVTPDAILKQFGCLSYNELFYDYDDRRPAIFYRPRPYSGSAWRDLPIVDVDPGSMVAINLSRSGEERFNYWRSSMLLSGFRGPDITVDSAQGKSPIIDQDDIRRHGLLPADPQDDFLPPIDDQNRIMEYARNRIGKFRKWYYHSPEMVTGSVTCSPAQPQIRIGTRVRLPVKYWFKGYEQKENVVGYVVEVNESVSIDPSVGTIVSSTNFLFVRGQPENGLEVPNPVPWKVAE